MLENATFPLPYYSKTLDAHFISLTVTLNEGYVSITGDRDPARPSSQAFVKAYEDASHSCNWLLKDVDVSNPLLDQELCAFWKNSDLPYAVKNAVEEIAYQHRRIISASEAWHDCEFFALSRGIIPFNKGITLRQYEEAKAYKATLTPQTNPVKGWFSR